MNKYFITNIYETKWNVIIDNSIRKKFQLININGYDLVLVHKKLIKEILEPYKFIAKKITEDDGSITLSLENIDLIENAPTLSEAKMKLAEAIKEYSYDFFNDFEFWGAAPNRKGHIPYLLKAALAESINEINNSIEFLKNDRWLGIFNEKVLHYN